MRASQKGLMASKRGLRASQKGRMDRRTEVQIESPKTIPLKDMEAVMRAARRTARQAKSLAVRRAASLAARQ